MSHLRSDQDYRRNRLFKDQQIHPTKMIFSIIIPAYNEEQSIQSIIERTQRACSHIIRNTSVDEVEIIVVNDGSSDKTKEFAQQYVGI